jgi:hypothetical protein
MRKPLCLLCLLGCLGCLAVFFSFRDEIKDEKGTKSAKWTMGLASSPWLVTSSEEQSSVEVNKGKGTVQTTQRSSESRRVVFLSASWSLLLGAIGLGVLCCWLWGKGLSLQRHYSY